MSLDSFRNQVLSNIGEERVQVNQRLLIDKILARYSSEFAVYRELMQNSDDAKSSSIQIIFETANNNIKPKEKVKVTRNPLNIFKKDNKMKMKDNKMENSKMENNKKMDRIIFKNDGFAFRNEDWDRLKKIAEGNPDEQKIGAFGVGFYSIFSVCEEPFVSSGGKGMAFYWRENQLFIKQGSTDDKDKIWTTFLMNTRDPIEFPDVEGFARFLANSLAFTGNLREISVYLNDTLVIQLSKKIKVPKLMKITSKFDTFSPQKIFRLTSVNVQAAQLSINRLLVPTNMNIKQWCSSQTNDFQTEEKSIFLRIANGNLDVKVDNETSKEMERTTKKKPPKKTTIQMIFSGFDEHNSHNKNISSAFKDLLPYPGQGRIYIGFPTQQTTGCCSHLAARVIPTVEREAIDLVEKTLAKYNSEMLCLAGTLCRLLYEDEVAQIARLYKKKIGVDGVDAKDDEDTKSTREFLEKWAAYALTHFTFNPSTPNAQVAKITESQFFNCSNQKLYILSTNGALLISNVRMPNPEMAGFIKKVPVVPNIILEQCDTFFKKAKDLKLIEELTFQDVLCELKSRVFSEDEIISLLKWWISYRSKENNVNTSEFTQFMQHSRGDKFQALSTIRNFLNPGIIPPDVDIPVEVLPYTISRNFKKQDLEKCFGWSELSLVNWARFIVNKPDLETNTFATRVHQILAKSLNNTSKSDKEIICQLFVRKKCIPTKFGMKIPNDAYFQNVNLFPDLPTIQFQKPLSVKNIMELLGVRKVVELKIIINRINNQEDCDHMELVKYLASISSELEENDIKILRRTPIWPKENLYSSKIQNIQRFIASDLYVPLALHREFRLPVINWKGRWSYHSQEGKFLIELGLREYPTLNKIIELAAHPTDPKIRNIALQCFLDNFEGAYSKDYNSSKINVAFLPCSDPNIYAKPSEVFINSECKIMKFQVIHKDLQFKVGKIGVRQHPNHNELINKLIKDPPQDKNKAKEVFEYLASQQGNFVHSDWNTLSNLKFIPVQTKPDTFTLTDPRSCFFKMEEKILNGFFSCVDFGEKANKFLQSCGVKNEPTPVEFAELLVKSSHELWNLIGDDAEKYLSVLRRIAVDFKYYRTISSKYDLVAKMKEAHILVAIKKKSNEMNSDNKDVNSYSLASAKEIFINDDIVYQQIFNPLTTPEEEVMETLYKELGCRSLHESVIETSTPRGTPQETERSQQLQKLIVERACLFYYKRSINNVKRDENWLKKLKIKEIDYIETTYTLGVAKEVKRNATSIIQDKCVLASWTLYITSNSSLDILEISQHIAKNIYKSCEWDDIFSLNVRLTTPLSALKKMGYPVDRILQQPKSYTVESIGESYQNQEAKNFQKLQEIIIGRAYLFFYNCPKSKIKNDENWLRKLKVKESENSTTVILQDYMTNSWILYITRNPNLLDISECIAKNIYKSCEPKDILNINLLSITPLSTLKNMGYPIQHCDQNLSNSIYDAFNFSSDLFGDINNIINSQAGTTIVNDTKTSYCDSTPGHSLFCVGAKQDIKLFDTNASVYQSKILSESFAAPLNRFINVLKEFLNVFDITTKTIHIFYDNNANSVAFNRDGTLFFNLKFYIELHDEECKIKPTINAMTYWFMTFCHELAHNFIKVHSFDHEHYFSSYAEIYMSKFLTVIRKYELL